MDHLSHLPLTNSHRTSSTNHHHSNESNTIMNQQEQQQKIEDRYNAQRIINEANDKYSSNKNELENAQMIYQSALLDWVDDAREMENNIATGNSSLEDVAVLKTSIATLWVEYANLNRTANMFKAATEAYEQAVNCPIAGNTGMVWKEYAKYQIERKRPKTAQKIYLRALVGGGESDTVEGGAVSNEKDRNELWEDFLAMVRQIKKDPSLTLEQLREAVDTEHTVKVREERIQAEIDAMSGADQPPSKKQKGMDMSSSSSSTSNAQRQQQQIITAEAVDSVASALIETTKNISPALNAEWLARDGNAQPTRPDPPLFSPSPPKLGDPSGKDLLGTELALKLIRILLNKSPSPSTSGGKDHLCEITGGTILDIVNGCWMMTALKEKEATKSQSALDKKLTGEYEKMESEFDSRLSVAGGALSVVEQMNANDKSHFMAMCNQQRQQLLSLVSSEFRHLLAIQQEILTKAGLPFFNGPTVDASSIRIQANICTFLHSAFYLRNRIGEKAHESMLSAQECRLASQEPVPMPIPKTKSTMYHLPPPPVPVPMPIPTQPIYAGQQPIYASQQPMPGQFPPPPQYPPQNQYQYR